MTLKGADPKFQGRIASQSPHHDPKAPGIRASSIVAHKTCSHCANVIEGKMIQVYRRSRENPSRSLDFCHDCWELIAGIEHIPDYVLDKVEGYECWLCNEAILAGDSCVVVSNKGKGKYPPTFGAFMGHEDCFLGAAGENFWS
jgi:hypothetical protein